MNGWRLVSAGALVLAAAAVAVAGLVYQHGNDQDDSINGNRVAQTRQSCHERNVERRTLRRKFAGPLIVSFKDQRDQTERVPQAAFAQFEVTKAEALARIDKAVGKLKQARADLHPLDCKKRVRAVRDSLD